MRWTDANSSSPRFAAPAPWARARAQRSATPCTLADAEGRRKRVQVVVARRRRVAGSAGARGAACAAGAGSDAERGPTMNAALARGLAFLLLWLAVAGRKPVGPARRRRGRRGGDVGEPDSRAALRGAPEFSRCAGLPARFPAPFAHRRVSTSRGGRWSPRSISSLASSRRGFRLPPGLARNALLRDREPPARHAVDRLRPRRRSQDLRSRTRRPPADRGGSRGRRGLLHADDRP